MNNTVAYPEKFQEWAKENNISKADLPLARAAWDAGCQTEIQYVGNPKRHSRDDSDLRPRGTIPPKSELPIAIGWTMLRVPPYDTHMAETGHCHILALYEDGKLSYECGSCGQCWEG